MNKRNAITTLEALREEAWQAVLRFQRQEVPGEGGDLGHVMFLIETGQFSSRQITLQMRDLLKMRGEVAGIDRALKAVRGMKG